MTRIEGLDGPGTQVARFSSSRPRLKDVACRAGVAANTASTILNRRPNNWASKETSARVFKAAEELGYQPSRVAVALRNGKFNTLGLLVPDLQNPFYTGLAEALETEAAVYGFDLILGSSRGDVVHETKYLQSIAERQVDGMICILIDPEQNRDALQNYQRKGKAVVVIHERGVSEVPVDAVVIDSHVGIVQAMQHLFGLKHRKIAFLLATHPGQQDGDRQGAYGQLAVESGFHPRDVEFAFCGHSLPDARAAACRLLRSSADRRPTAILAYNDLAATGVIRGAMDLGLTVPGDLSVVGGDHIQLGQHLTTTLTTLDLPVYRIVAEATAMLRRRLDDPQAAGARQSNLSSRLVIGESTGRRPGAMETNKGLS